MNKFKIKNKGNALIVGLSLVMNVALYAIAIFITLFSTEFNFKALLPHQMSNGMWDPGVLIIAGIVQSLGILFFKNSQWGRKLKLTNDKAYIRNNLIINKFLYLISDDDFRDYIHITDLNNKKDTWKILVEDKLQKFMSKMPKKVAMECDLPPEKHSEKTKKWFKKVELMKLQLSQEWIDENITKVKIKYPRINVKMVIRGYSDFKISRMAITDVKKIQRDEDIHKIIFAILAFVWVAFIATIGIPQLRKDVWVAVKDYLVYSVSILMNLINGILSGNTIHKYRLQETEDRKIYIRKFVGDELYSKYVAEVDRELKTDKIIELENQLVSIDK